MGANFAIPLLASILILGGFGLTQQAFAAPISLPHTNADNCDFLFIDPRVDELGSGPEFPPDELISVVDLFTSTSPACLGSFPGPGPDPAGCGCG